MTSKRLLISENDLGDCGNLLDNDERRTRQKLNVSDARHEHRSVGSFPVKDLEPDLSSRRIYIESGLDIGPHINRSLVSEESLWSDGLAQTLSAAIPTSKEPSNAETAMREHASIPNFESNASQETICFGMLPREMVRLVGQGQYLRNRLGRLKENGFVGQAFRILPSSEGQNFLYFPDSTALGYLSKKLNPAIKLFADMPDFEMEAWVAIFPVMDALAKAKTATQAAIRVDIHVYGLATSKDEVGQHLSKGKLFLQHPKICRPNARYDNPHVLSIDDLGDSDIEEDTDFSEEEEEVVSSMEYDGEFEDTIATVFQSLRRGDNLNQVKGAENLACALYPHQEEAFDFMTQRETGEITAEYRLWQPKTKGAERVFSHVVTHAIQHEVVDESGGGILADEMGMGKTLTTLVFIGKTLRDAHQWVANNSQAPTHTSAIEKFCRATLVIVPQQLLITIWKREVERFKPFKHQSRMLHRADHWRRHLKGSLKVMAYHGPRRKNLLTGIDNYDIVITTYNTLAREHEGKLLGENKSPLHDIFWYRVVLDEAHIIRRRSTTLHKAVVNLYAKARWALSGTPIQNSLTDLASLLSFLQVRPFHETGTFRHWIGRPFEEKESRPRAIKRLVDVLNAVCLRRNIKRANLPGKAEQTRMVHFSTEERLQYDRTYSMMQRFIQQQTGEYNQDNSFGMFQVLLQLRSFCNHGTHQRELSWIPRDILDDEAVPVRSITRDSYERCLICRQKLSIVKHQRIKKDSDNCRHALCNECAGYGNQSLNTMEDFHCPLCDALQEPHPSGSSMSESRHMVNDSSLKLMGQSSKMQALLNDVRNDSEYKKSIIFSCWTRTLDLIARHLMGADVQFKRIDGRTKSRQRQSIIDAFNDSGLVSVLIMTTGTGAVGLNLQSANRVYIVEPQWNPSVEDQAISRAIRLGQEQQVQVIRYRVENSIEEDMYKQQTHKLKISKLDFSKQLTSVSQETRVVKDI